MIELYYWPTSHWSRVISLVLAEKGLAHERRVVDITKNATFEPEYLRLNARGVVPTLVHDGRAITNAPTIAAYLDELAPPRVCRPETAAWDLRLEELPTMLLSYSVWVRGQRGERSATILDDKVERAARYAELHPELRALYDRKREFFERFRAEVYDEAHVAEEERRTADTLEEMAELTERSGTIHASGWSLSDAIATSVLYRLADLRRVDHWVGRDHPLQRYYDRVRARPSFAAVFTDDPNLP